MRSIIRPSLLFGAGDSFFNRFAALARLLPILPLAGAETRFQPVFVGDVAEAIARAVDGKVPGGRIYEAGGPEIRTLRDLVEFVLRATERRAIVLSLPKAARPVQGSMLGLVDKLTLGLLPDDFVMTRDQAIMLETDNVVSEKAIAEGRTLQGIGIEPTSFEAIVPSYLVRFRRTGQFDLKRNSARLRRPGTRADPVPLESEQGSASFARKCSQRADRQDSDRPRDGGMIVLARDAPSRLCTCTINAAPKIGVSRLRNGTITSAAMIAPAANTVPRFSTRIRAESSSDRKRPAASSKYSRPSR